MKLRFIGCGDAFGSGGRFNSCLHVSTAAGDRLLDLGASSFYALKQTGLDPNRIATIYLTHFHGDHFGGLPYFILDAQFMSMRKEPLTIVGPPGVAETCGSLLEICYPGSSTVSRDFEIRYREIRPDETLDLDGDRVTAHAVLHDPTLAHCLGYRFEADGKVLAVSGDTTWTETLIPLAREADLFVVECYVRSRRMKVHMDYATLRERLPDVGARRVVLTHMSRDILDNPDEIAHEMAHDGLTIEL